jgi:rhodanese-related sulfurtransferase
MLLWPYVRRTTGGPWVDITHATLMINREDALVVDVREPAEYGAGHILGAKNVPLAGIQAGAGELAKKKSRPLIVYCDSSARSSSAVAALRRQGFERVVNLSGGLGAWQQAGLPVEK